MRNTCIDRSTLLGGGGLSNGEEITVTLVHDGHDTNAEELSGSSSKCDVRTSVVVDGSLGQHGVVLDFRLAEGRAITSDEDELGLATTHLLQGRLVPKRVFSRLHDEGQTRSNGLVGLGGLRFLAGSHCEGRERLGGSA